MSAQTIFETTKTLMAVDIGPLAMDERNPTCNQRFAKLGITQTEKARRAYRELILTTPGLGESISGAILYDDTIRQTKKDGTPFAEALCQEASIVPIVEPEVLMDGDHSLDQCARVTDETLHAVSDHLYLQRVMLEGIILKPNMVLPGLACPRQESVEEVADATVACLLRAVPVAVADVAFLSGGKTAKLASERLNAMNERFKGRMPRALTSSYSRAVQQSALEIWRGEKRVRSRRRSRRWLIGPPATASRAAVNIGPLWRSHQHRRHGPRIDSLRLAKLYNR